MKNLDKFSIGILPGIASLYNRAWPELQVKLAEFISETAADLKDKGFDVFTTQPVSNPQQANTGCKKLISEGIDLLIVALSPYCPSGALVPVLSKIKVPVLVWPVQSLFKLEADKYDNDVVILNHGVHGVQDLANVLKKSGKQFGITHGHLKQPDFVQELTDWARAGRTICAMQSSRPVQIGGHFEDMMDLQIGTDKFIRDMGLKLRTVSCDKFAKLLKSINNKDAEKYLKRYRSNFAIGRDVDDNLLLKTARGEAAVRKLMEEEKSTACGLNFLELCNDKRISDGLHVAASILMEEGFGYAAEGDWVTAVLVRGMQKGFGIASFTEMFSVGYADNRIVLKHWGEGNFAMGRAKPGICLSKMNDKTPAEFAIVDFEFKPEQVTLINLNSSKDSQGQLISINGTVTKDHLTKITGPRAIFKQERKDVRELLNDYAYSGGSHHLAMVNGNADNVLEKISRLAGWTYIKL